MEFQVKKATREKIFPKVALMAPSGGGKTYSALRLATGYCAGVYAKTGKKTKILLANTEGSRGEYYANEFSYDICDINPPHDPEKYVDLINFAVKENYDVLIIDSSSHEWEGKGGCLDLQQQAGGTWNSWAKVTPRHNKFINAISDSPIMIIATMRGKDQYEVEKDGDSKKVSVKKLGIGAKQREGFEYEFTVTFLLDQKTNLATVQKDNTHLFEHDGDRLLSESDGEKIFEWANTGEGYTPRDHASDEPEENLPDVKKKIITKCTELGGSKNQAMMDLLRSYVPSGNPNALKSMDNAKKLLGELDKIAPIQ